MPTLRKRKAVCATPSRMPTRCATMPIAETSSGHSTYTKFTATGPRPSSFQKKIGKYLIDMPEPSMLTTSAQATSQGTTRRARARRCDTARCSSACSWPSPPAPSRTPDSMRSAASSALWSAADCSIASLSVDVIDGGCREDAAPLSPPTTAEVGSASLSWPSVSLSLNMKSIAQGSSDIACPTSITMVRSFVRHCPPRAAKMGMDVSGPTELPAVRSEDL